MVLDCGSPLPLSPPQGPKSGRGLPQSKTLRGLVRVAAITRPTGPTGPNASSPLVPELIPANSRIGYGQVLG